MPFLSEAAVEQALLEQFRALGYAVESEENIGPDGHRPERQSHDEVLLQKRLTDAVARLNPGMPLVARQDACRRLTQTELPNMLEENRRLHQLMTEGVDVEYYADDGVLTAGKVALIDFERPERNDWLVVNQFVVIAGQGQQVYKRRPDVVVFYDGINDVMATVQNGRAGLPQNEANREEDFRSGRLAAAIDCPTRRVASSGRWMAMRSNSSGASVRKTWRAFSNSRLPPCPEVTRPSNSTCLIS